MKAFWKFFKEPQSWFIWVSVLCMLVCVAAALTFVCIGYTGFLSYIAYALAACTLGYTVYLFVRFAPKMKASIMAGLQRHTFTRNLTGDYSFRTLVFALCSFAINLAFVAFNTVFALLTKNAWYGSLAGYYFLLSCLRGFVFYGEKRAKTLPEEEGRVKRLQNYGLCGVALFLLDVAMAVAVTFMVLQEKPNSYTEIMAIVFAAYTFYKLTLAIWNIFKAKKVQDLQIQAFRNISLVDAAISLLSLQVTLVATFSEGEGMLALNAMTGACVCLLTVGIGVWMILQANKQRKKYGK